MENKIANLFGKMCDKNEDESFEYADKLAKIGTEEVVDELIRILKGEDMDSAILAARALSKTENNEKALEPLLELIHDTAYKNKNGAFVQALEGFDLGSKFVDILRIYLFGNFKASALAKEYLDYTEFDLTPRVIKKIEKHWSHFENNISKEDDEYIIKKQEIEKIRMDMKELFESE
ncbi:HEAT repeat domain-containing protein [Rhodonellum sp.]|uniref:HEAT repeat domain-containing protein n=1 Tax=Rhodonellum sp. TaxID=2231180 RepID=UPI002721D475|nr:HEAT repeat domain-containing protein [Rhodonellum sp.]MDO9553920.1 HEAT repeat domain-containing protein [Rhodonellum sp.]